MRRAITSSVIAIVVALLFVTAIFAGTYRSPNKDTTCGDTPTDTQCYNGSGIYIETSGNIDTGACDNPEYIGYIGWDLTNETRTWIGGSLKLYAYDTAGGGPTYEFTLYPANTDNWTETGTNPGFDSSTVLATASADLSSASTTNMVPIEFASDELGSYFLNKKGGEATLAVVMTGGCSLNASVWFEDTDGTGGSAPASANEPDLIFWTGHVVNGTPTAVEMKTIQAETNTSSDSNWPMIAGLFALGAAVLVGLGYGLRRSKQS